MRKIFWVTILIFTLFSCKEEEIKSYYKVSIVHHEKDFIKGDYFHPLLDRIELTTYRYLLKVEDSLITLYFEEDFDTNQIRNVILNDAKIEFWHTFNNTAIGNSIYEITNKLLSENMFPGFRDSIENIEVIEIEDMPTIYLTDEQVDSIPPITKEVMEQNIFNKSNPLSTYLYPNANQMNQWNEGPILGYAKIRDTGIINNYLSKQYIIDSLNIRNLKFLWDAKSTFTTNDGDELLNLYLVKNTRTGKANLDRSDIKYALQDEDPLTNKPIINLQFTPVGSKIWGDMTEKSFRNQSGIAITFNNKVYSAPMASGRIEGGNTQITGGSFHDENGEEEAKRIARAINLDPLPNNFTLHRIEILNNYAK